MITPVRPSPSIPTPLSNLSLYSNSINLDILGFYNPKYQDNNPSQVSRKFLMFSLTQSIVMLCNSRYDACVKVIKREMLSN